MIPPRSPYGLIQEDLWPDRWKILLACMFLNCTSRKQAEKILPSFFKKWPTPQALISCDVNQLKDTIKSLGFVNRRSESILKMSKAFIQGNWKDPRDLPGIGEYAGTSYEIFCMGIIRPETPSDGILAKYHSWRVKHFTDLQTKR